MKPGDARAPDIVSRMARWVIAHRLPMIVGLAALMFLAIAIRAERREDPRLLISERTVAAVRSDLGPGAPPGDSRDERMRDWRPPPEFVKGIYVHAETAGSPKQMQRLVDLVDRTELNAMVIDVKEGGGELAFAPADPELAPFASKTPSIGDLKAFTAPLREKDIYLIARIFVFQDPSLVAKRPEVAVRNRRGGIWRDRRGTPWIDAADKVAWDYTVRVAREAYDGGFDEVQLDYIRFPSDGVMSDIVYPVYDGKKPKDEVLGEFFAYFDDALKDTGLFTSVDLFGLVMWQHEYDLGIGQRLEVAVPHFDFVSPMVYPSHYPATWGGYANPAAHPYDVIYRNLVRGQPVTEKLRAADPEARIATIRPWIQDFHMGATYDAAKVKAQMKASVDGGATGWLLWNARNVYTESALAPEER